MVVASFGLAAAPYPRNPLAILRKGDFCGFFLAGRRSSLLQLPAVPRKGCCCGVFWTSEEEDGERMVSAAPVLLLPTGVVSSHDAREQVEDEDGQHDLAALLVDGPVEGPGDGEEDDAHDKRDELLSGPEDGGDDGEEAGGAEDSP